MKYSGWDPNNGIHSFSLYEVDVQGMNEEDGLSWKSNYMVKVEREKCLPLKRNA